MNEVNECLYNKGKNSNFNIFLNILIGIVAVMLMFEIFFISNYQGFYVVGKSMEPTLNGAVSETQAGGDYLYVRKNEKPTYGDIVVLQKNENNSDGKIIIKRVIALAGDRVKLIDGVLYLKHPDDEDFQIVEEPYVDSDKNKGDGPQSTTFPKSGGKLVEEGYLVGEDKIFLLGDNRDVSSDSRVDGAYPMANLCGVVAEWSYDCKGFFSSLHNFFYFELPSWFGVKRS